MKMDRHNEPGGEAGLPPSSAQEHMLDASDEMLAATVVDAIGDGTRLRDLHGIPEHVMNGIHAYAYDFYRQGRLDEAEAFFRFLCLYDFYNADYATGLAAVFQLQGRYRQAIDMYGVAMRLGLDDVSPVFYAGQCFVKLGVLDDAVDCFAFVVAETRDASLRERANAYLASLATNVQPFSGSGTQGDDQSLLMQDGEAA
ncbi:MAG: SycD/LcrH family type III secretion system chaperone [Pararobbsia sp.]